MNIFVSAERVTAIDLDTFALRGREVDVAYFLAQTAIFGIHLHESFAATHDLRTEFVRECGDLNQEQVVAYMAWALLQSLHYDLCILRIKNESVDLMLGAANRLLSTGSDRTKVMVTRQRVRQFYKAFGPFLKPYRWQIAGAYGSAASNRLYDAASSLAAETHSRQRHPRQEKP